MNTITDINEANALLAQYNGAEAQVWRFHVTHKRLLLRLSLPSIEKVVYLVGVSCENINGPFSWKNAHIGIARKVDKKFSETITKITDAKAGFELITSGGFALAYSSDVEFETFFGDFSTGIKPR